VRAEEGIMDPATILWAILAVIIAWFLLDLLLAGGGMTGGMMAGMGAMMGSGPGLVVLLLLIIIGLLLYAMT
jgi:hypothetical protein